MDPDNHSHPDAPLVPVDEETQDAEEVARRAYLQAIATARTGFDLLLSQIDPGASDPMVLDAKNTLTDWRGQLAQEGPSGDDCTIQSGIDLKVDGSLRTTIIDHLEMAASIRDGNPQLKTTTDVRALLTALKREISVFYAWTSRQTSDDESISAGPSHSGPSGQESSPPLATVPATTVNGSGGITHIIAIGTFSGSQDHETRVVEYSNGPWPTGLNLTAFQNTRPYATPQSQFNFGTYVSRRLQQWMQIARERVRRRPAEN